MTISATEPLVAGPYNGNGVTTVFNYDMTIFSADELLVFLRDAAGVETLQTITTNYTVAPTGGTFPATGGTVTMLVAPPTGVQLIILPDITRSQDRPFSSQSSITLQEVEDALDKLTAITRQLYERSLRAVTVSAFDPGDVETLLANVTALVALEAEITTLTANITAIQNVNANEANIDTVAANMASVVALAAINAAISTVAANIASVNTVASNIANVNIVAAAVAALNTVASSIANVNTVAGSIANVNAVAAELADVSTVADNIASVISANPALYRMHNKIINGNFRVAQRGASSGVVGYTSLDRWFNGFVGGTSVMSQQAQVLGTKFGQNTPSFFGRQVVAGQTLASHYAAMVQNIEDVRSYAGETITVLGWARRSGGSGNMAVNADQNFGTGGSPSADVAVNGQQVALTGSWAPFAVTLAVPSISGKTLGSNNNDKLAIVFWTSAGADFNARSGSLGLQAVTVDLWGVHVLRGTHPASMALSYVEQPLAETLHECQRYFFSGGAIVFSGNVTNAFGYIARAELPVTMRALPVVTLTNSAASNFPAASGTPGSSLTGVQETRTASGTAAGFFASSFTADAEL